MKETNRMDNGETMHDRRRFLLACVKSLAGGMAVLSIPAIVSKPTEAEGDTATTATLTQAASPASTSDAGSPDMVPLLLQGVVTWNERIPVRTTSKLLSVYVIGFEDRMGGVDVTVIFRKWSLTGARKIDVTLLDSTGSQVARKSTIVAPDPKRDALDASRGLYFEPAGYVRFIKSNNPRMAYAGAVTDVPVDENGDTHIRAFRIEISPANQETQP